MKLLYAEDEAAMSEAVVDILTYHNYLVDAVYDGEEALAYAQAEQLLSILLDNAVKYGSQGSAVRVSLRKEDRRLWLTVENTCDALPQVPPEKLFHRFYREDAARTQKSGGYGIGLAVARSIVQGHKGTLQARYLPGNRISFTVCLQRF